MRLKKVLKIMIRLKLPAVLTALIIISGCAANRIILHPIDKVDIVKMPKGIPYTPEKDGWFLSDYYLDQVVKAKIDK